MSRGYFAAIYKIYFKQKIELIFIPFLLLYESLAVIVTTMTVTTIFENVDECISFARNALTTLPNINALIDDNDFKKWTDKLTESPDFEKYLCESPFNLLSTLVIKGLADKRQLQNPIFSHVNTLLVKVDLFLNSFPELKTDTSFKSN